MCVLKGRITFDYVLNNCKIMVLSNVLNGMLSSSNSSSVVCMSTHYNYATYVDDENDDEDDEDEGDEDDEGEDNDADKDDD